MELEPTLKVALALHSSPGVYALLLGSGVSTSAGILTGWQVVLDLVDRLARAQGEDPGDDPAAWYVEKYREQPDYSQLLDAVTTTPTERMNLLRSYFEPTDEKREEARPRANRKDGRKDLRATSHIPVRENDDGNRK